jgi:endoglucanase
MHAGRILRGGLAAGILLGCVSCGSGGDETTNDPKELAGSMSLDAAASAFLDRYVTDDGAVVRSDQGGDVVSEGQAYAMLIAEAAGRTDVVPTIWQWASDHLQRDDRLLAFHANADGSVISQASATDADILAAFALLRYDGANASALHADGRRLADAVIAHETVSDGSGRLVLVAGDWATGSPAVVNPSYWMPGVFAELSRLTGDDRWSAMASTVVSLVDDATSGGSTLPPDWGQLVGTTVTATPDPDGSTGVQYGLDAQRMPLWFAFGCSHQATDLAAGWWDLLASPDSAGAVALSLDGSVINGDTSPLSYVAAATAARAAGDQGDAASLVKNAEQQAQASPTYYGDAWVALALALEDGLLADCGTE